MGKVLQCSVLNIMILVEYKHVNQVIILVNDNVWNSYQHQKQTKKQTSKQTKTIQKKVRKKKESKK